MPLWILIIDYILGIIMWTLIGRSAMNIFQREDSNFFFMKAFVKFTNPIIKIFRLMAKFPKIKEIGRRVNKNIDILLNMCICEFKSLICSNI